MSSVTTRYNANVLTVSPDGRSLRKLFEARHTERATRERNAYLFLATEGYRHAPGLLRAAVSDGKHCLEIERIAGVSLSEWRRRDPAAFGEKLRQLGAAVRAYHRLTPRSPLAATSDAEIRAGWQESLEAALAYVDAVAPGAIARDLVARRLADDLDRQASSFRPSLVHRDLRCDNVVVDEANGTWIVDWEMSTVGHPELDLARLLWFDLEDEPGLVEAFLDGYGGGVPDDRRLLFRVLFATEMLQYLSHRASLREEELALRARLIEALRMYALEGVVSRSFVLEQAYPLPGDVILAAGSLVEGYGNPFSDIDVYVLTDRLRRADEVNLARHHRVVDRRREIIRAGDRESEVLLVHTVVPNSGRKVDIEFRTRDQVAELCGKVEDLYRYATSSLALFAKELPIRDKLFLHRLYAGVPLVNEPGLASIRAAFDVRKYWYVMYRWLASDFSHLLDLMGAWANQEWLRCADLAHRELTREMMAFLHLRGHTFPNPKWLLSFLERLPPDDAPLVARYVELFRMPGTGSDPGAQAYALAVADFLDLLYQKTVPLLEASELFPSGPAALDQLDREASGSEEPTGYAAMEFAYRRKVYGVPGPPVRAFIERPGELMAELSSRAVR
jgi:aminoglycoside phosphotransferase